MPPHSWQEVIDGRWDWCLASQDDSRRDREDEGEETEGSVQVNKVSLLPSFPHSLSALRPWVFLQRRWGRDTPHFYYYTTKLIFPNSCLFRRNRTNSRFRRNQNHLWEHRDDGIERRRGVCERCNVCLERKTIRAAAKPRARQKVAITENLTTVTGYSTELYVAFMKRVWAGSLRRSAPQRNESRASTSPSFNSSPC